LFVMLYNSRLFTQLLLGSGCTFHNIFPQFIRRNSGQPCQLLNIVFWNTVKMEATHNFETSVTGYQPASCHDHEDCPENSRYHKTPLYTAPFHIASVTSRSSPSAPAHVADRLRGWFACTCALRLEEENISNRVAVKQRRADILYTWALHFSR
jgi:hypothetical protein